MRDAGKKRVDWVRCELDTKASNEGVGGGRIAKYNDRPRDPSARFARNSSRTPNRDVARSLCDDYRVLGLLQLERLCLRNATVVYFMLAGKTCSHLRANRLLRLSVVLGIALRLLLGALSLRLRVLVVASAANHKRLWDCCSLSALDFSSNHDVRTKEHKQASAP